MVRAPWQPTKLVRFGFTCTSPFPIKVLWTPHRSSRQLLSASRMLFDMGGVPGQASIDDAHTGSDRAGGRIVDLRVCRSSMPGFPQDVYNASLRLEC